VAEWQSLIALGFLWSGRDFAQAVTAAADLARSDFAAEIERNMRRLPAALAETSVEVSGEPADGAD